ncbi:RNA polymerase sigma factor, partial [Streptomyces sp. NPDC059477]|uniref:RNA polymerase sigma factor n=1 Tax=Streptomyces sp. NPDC059477 TaxID=3346847 RepID=UPI0036A516C7
DEVHLPSTDIGPEQWLERTALRDWVWEALEELSPVLRMPLVLRHFAGGVTSHEQMPYERIEDACGVPVGTVRSRLSQGRAKLATALAATADAPHGDAEQRVRASRNEARRMLAAARERSHGPADRPRGRPEVAVTSPAVHRAALTVVMRRPQGLPA